MPATPVATTPRQSPSFWELVRILKIGEILRLLVGGREYREKRFPELIADLVASLQDENALAGVLSDFFRTHFIDENETAMVFTVGRLLRARGGRWIVIAEVLEAVPDISEEMRRRPEMQIGTPEERQALLKEAIATRVGEKFEEVKARLPADTTAVQEPGPGLRERFTALLGGMGSGLGEMAKTLFGLALLAFQFVAFWVGASVLYLMLAVFVAFVFPAWMPLFAWISFIVFVGIPAVAMMVSAPFGRAGAAFQAAAGTLLAYFSSSLLVIVFTLAALCAVATGTEHYGILCMGQIIVVVWDRVIFGLTQKAAGLPGFFAKGIAAISDGKITEEEVKGFAAHWKDNTFLVVISVTVAGAINAAWLLVSLIAIFQNPLFFPLGVGMIGLQLVLGGAYVRMALKQGRDGEYSKHLGLEAHIKTWSHRLYNGSMITSVAAPLIAAALICGFFFVKEENASQWFNDLRASSVEAVSRTTSVGGERDGRTSSDVEESTRKGGSKATQKNSTRSGGKMLDCGSSGMKSAATVEARKKSLGILVDGEYKPRKGTEKSYPWNCR